MSTQRQEVMFSAAETDEIRGGTFRFSGLPCFSVTRNVVAEREGRAFRVTTFRVHALHAATAGRVADWCKWRIEEDAGMHR